MARPSLSKKLRSKAMAYNYQPKLEGTVNDREVIGSD